MYNRGFGGGFGGFGGGGGNFGNQFSGNRFQSGFVGGPGGNNGLMGMNRGGFRSGFNVGQRFGGPMSGGFQQQRGGGLFGRGRGSYTPRGGSRGGSRNNFNRDNDSGKKEGKQDDRSKDVNEKDSKREDETKKSDSEKKGVQSQKDVIELKPRPASMDFGGPVKKANDGGKKANEKEKEADSSVAAKPPWETKKKAENKQDPKVDKVGAPWEKKKNDDLAQKASNAPWETKKTENKFAPPWSKKQEQKEVPPWKQADVKEEVIDVDSPSWQESEEDKSIGPPPWLQQQRNKSEPEKPQPQPLMEQPIVKKEPLFDSRKRQYDGSQQSQPRVQGPAVKVAPMVPNQQQMDTRATLDRFNSDLNLIINNDGYSAETLNKPMGFCFCWAGARATYGVTRGKICFEVKVTRDQAVDFGDDHEEADPHVLRVGWSVDSHGFQLGEDDDSFGFGGTGKFSANCKFSNYGQTFGVGDVIMALLDLEAKPPNISFAKNGRWFGVAHRLGAWPLGVKEKALFPHVLSKNYAFEVNFGQKSPWFQPPPDFVFIDDVSLHQRVRGMMPPAKVSDCEIIMIVGLPGAGKTTWGRKMQVDHPDKRYNIIGTDTLIDKMKVNGLPRKNNYHGRWERLIQKATECLNKLFQIGSKKSRNYILDQTNVYATARKRKMRNFEGFKRICAVLITENHELERRSYQRTYVDGKFVPDEAVLEMKANFSLPHESEPHVDRILWIEHTRERAIPMIEQYNSEGQKNRPSRSKAFPQDNRSQSQDRRNNRDSSEGRGGHQRSFSDRGPQGDRGRSYERNQDHAPPRGAWDKRGIGFQGGPANRDQSFPDRMPGGRDKADTNKRPGLPEKPSWQQQPGNVREQVHSGRDNSPVARREDIPFKKPKVEPLDTGYRGDRDTRDQAWPPQSGQIKEERMDQGYDKARFGGGGNRFLGDKDVDYRFSGGPDTGRPSTGSVTSPFDRDDRNQSANRYAQDGPGQFRSPESSFNQPMKLESPFMKTEENPFLTRLAEFDKERPLRFDQYVKNSTRNEDDTNKGFGFRRGNTYGGRSGNRFGQEGRSGGENRFSSDNRFGGNNRNDHFLAQGPGGFNKDRQDKFKETSRTGFDRDNYGARTRMGAEDGRLNRGSDDRYRDRGERRRDDGTRDRREYDRKPDPKTTESRYGLGEEWSGGGDNVEWQGGGDLPPQMRRFNDPKEAGDGAGAGPRDANRGSGDKDQRWDTDNKKQNWNQGQQWYGQGDGSATKDVDYRQRSDQYGKQKRTEAENYSTRGWNEGKEDKPEQKKQPEAHAPYEYSQPRNDQYQHGEWKEPEKSGWQGGGNEKTANRWENPKGAEEWSGGWGSNGAQQETSANPGQRSDDTSGWSANQYGSEYNQQYYQAGYDDQRAQQYDTSYTGSSKATATEHQAYSQEGNKQTSSQDWDQYGQQSWEGYGQSAGYGDWTQQAATSGGSEAKAAEVGTTATSNQAQYSSWSEYKAASTTGSTSGTDPNASTSSVQGANNQYGHYSQTSTTLGSDKNDTQQWESSSYGYGTPAQSGSNNAYSYSAQGSSAANTSPQISQASILGAAANISLPPNLDLNVIQQSLAAHGFTQPPPPPPPGPAPSGGLYPSAAAYQAGSGLAGVAPGVPHTAGMYPAGRRQ